MLSPFDMEMIFLSHVNETHLLRLCAWPHSEARVFGNRKWDIDASSFNFSFCFIT